MSDKRARCEELRCTPPLQQQLKETGMKRKGSVAATVLLLFGVVMLPATPAQKQVDKPTDAQKTQSSDSTNSKNRQTSKMIVSAVQFTFAANDAAKAETLLREIRDASRKEPGVVRFDV